MKSARANDITLKLCVMDCGFGFGRYRFGTSINSLLASFSLLYINNVIGGIMKRKNVPMRQ